MEPNVPHVNSRYEYMTREVATSHMVVSSDSDQEIEAAGWRRAWADVTMEGTFIVYRRERPVATGR